MTKWKVPLYRVFTNKDDIIEISKVIKRGMNWALGPEIEDFENKLSKYVGCDYCIAFNSGTSAQHAALLVIGIKSNENVIVPSFTFISTANSVLMIGAKPKFADIEEQTYGLDPTSVEKSIDKKTKVIMPIHYAGLPCLIDELSDIAKRKKIVLIEDAAESLGSTINKKKIGSHGVMTIFSFAGNKVLTSGEGGAIVTNSKKFYDKLKLIRSHGRREYENYFNSNLKPDYIELGYNWRMSSITAALATSQLKKLDKMISLRRKNANLLSLKLAKYDKIRVPKEPRGYKHVYQLYSIRLPSNKIRNDLMKFLTKKGIMSKIYFEPVHKTPFYQKLGYAKRKLRITETVSNQILSLPLFPNMTSKEIKLIDKVINDFMKNL